MNKIKFSFAVSVGMIYLLMSIGSALAAPKIEISMSVWGMPWENILYTDIDIPEFQKQNPDIKVKFYHFPAGNYADKLMTLFAGGEAPDVMRAINFQLPLFSSKHVFAPLDEYIDGPEGFDRDDFVSGVWEGVKIKGKTYAIPTDTTVVDGLFYNKDMFDEIGLEYPTNDWTWDEAIEAATKLTVRKAGRVGVYGLNMMPNHPYTLFSFMPGTGAKLWNEDKTKCIISNPETVAAIELMQDLVFKYRVSPSPAEIGNIDYAQFFKANRAAMMLAGVWVVPSIKKDAPGINFAVTTMPKGTVSKKVYAASCCFALNAQSEYSQEAWKLLKFLTSTEALMDYWQKTWVTAPSRLSVLNSPDFKNVTGVPGYIPAIETEQEFVEKVQWIYDILKNGWFTMEYAGPYFTQLFPFPLMPALDSVFLKEGRKDVKEMLDKLQADVNSNIEKVTQD